MIWLCGKAPPWKQLAKSLREQVRDLRRRERRLEQKLKGSYWTNDALQETNEELRQQIDGQQAIIEGRSDRILVNALARANRALAERVRDAEAEPARWRAMFSTPEICARNIDELRADLARAIAENERLRVALDVAGVVEEQFRVQVETEEPST